MMKKTEIFKNRRRRKHWVRKILVSLFSIFFFPAVVILYVLVESDFDFEKIYDIGSLINAVWFSVVTMTTTGYGDIVPDSFLGRSIAIVFMILGVVTTSLFTGALSSFLINRKISKITEEKGLLKMKKHIIILGFKNDIHLLINEILTYDPSIYIDDIVLVANVDVNKMDNIIKSYNLQGIKYIQGDYSDEAVLINAGAKKAKKVVVIPNTFDSNDAESIDAKTAVIVMMLKSLNPEIYICAEVLTLKYKKHLTSFKCDEVIYGSQYTRFLLANAVNYAGITNVVDTLLNTNNKKSVLSLEPVITSYIGSTIKNVADEYKEKWGHIIIGVVENMGAERKLKREAISEAQKTPDISKLVKSLKEARVLEKNKAIINPDDSYILRKHSALIVIKSSQAIS